MKRICTIVSLAALVMGLGSCGNAENPMLIFGQKHTVGIEIGASPTEYSGELTLGYKDQNIAIVPVSVKQSTGDSLPIHSTATDGFTDALSVLGQFDVDVDGRQGQVTLGKFFATGTAASKLAEGFSDKLAAEGAQSARQGPLPQPVNALTTAAELTQ